MEKKHNIWVYIELVDGKPSQLSLELLGKGRELADSRNKALMALLVGKGAEEAASEVIGYGADIAVVVSREELESFNASLYTETVQQILTKYEASAMLIGASPDGRDLGGRLSAAMNLGLVADCIDCRYEGDDDSLTWIRPAYTGKLFVKILTTTRPQLATIGERIFRGNTFDSSRTGEIIKEDMALGTRTASQKVTAFESLPPLDETLTIETADLVVGAGRGVGDEEGLKQVADFAASIGAPLGVSKPLVDNGWMPHDAQIGVTGKKIAPKIYIALGISGAIQHQLGLKEAELIIAVNTDPNAPIFKFANYGIVGNLFEVMPVLQREIKKLQAK